MSRVQSEREKLKRKAAAMNETQCAEVLEYIAIMQAMKNEGDRPDLFADVSVRDTAARVNGGRASTKRYTRSNPSLNT